jgi:acetate kinase
MAIKPLILIANPGSASRKYALYEGDTIRIRLHFEYDDGQVICTVDQNGELQTANTGLHDVTDAVRRMVPMLREYEAISGNEQIDAIGLRIVVPSSYFLEDRQLTPAVIAKLEELKDRAPLHIAASLQELKGLSKQFPDVRLYGISDSTFHRNKPDYAWNYGLPLHDADRLDIKRFGYHGLAAASAVNQLRAAGKLTPKVVIAHLGSGASVTAIHNGKSVDNTMGYSPLEGLIMSTRSGSVDVTAAQVLRAELGFTEHQLDKYLNQSGGLLGLGGSADIRELLKREAAGNHQAKLALNTYIYTVQKAIGAMAAALGGLDQLVFTGTVSERSPTVRQHILQRLNYLDFSLDQTANKQCDPQELTLISRLAHSKPIHVVPIDEAAEMARQIKIQLAAAL